MFSSPGSWAPWYNRGGHLWDCRPTATRAVAPMPLKPCQAPSPMPPPPSGVLAWDGLFQNREPDRQRPAALRHTRQAVSRWSLVMSFTAGCGEKHPLWRASLAQKWNCVRRSLCCFQNQESQAFSWETTGRTLFLIWGCGISLQVTFVSKLFELIEFYLKLFFWIKKWLSTISGTFSNMPMWCSN